MNTASDAVTLVTDAIHNPADARHFMRIARPEYPVTASLGDIEVARSTRVLKVKEVGYDIYDPVIYFPREDVVMDRLRRNDKTTHCPLKGDTEYFDALADGEVVENAAWSYDRTIEIARELETYVGFDTRRVQIVEHTAGPAG